MQVAKARAQIERKDDQSDQSQKTRKTGKSVATTSRVRATRGGAKANDEHQNEKNCGHGEISGM